MSLQRQDIKRGVQLIDLIQRKAKGNTRKIVLRFDPEMVIEMWSRY
jgi:hypothetical protein